MWKVLISTFLIIWGQLVFYIFSERFHLVLTLRIFFTFGILILVKKSAKTNFKRAKISFKIHKSNITVGKKTFITFFKNVLKNIQLKPKKPKKTQKTQYPKWDFKVILGFLGFLGLNPRVYHFLTSLGWNLCSGSFISGSTSWTYSEIFRPKYWYLEVAPGQNVLFQR